MESFMSDLIRKDFARQALACELLGSPFTGRVCRLLGERLGDTSRFGARVLGWEGNPQADALPLRAAGGFHALKRQGDAALAAAYPPKEVDNDALWAALDAAIAAHDDFLHGFLDSAPQTNEVSRSNAILGAALHVAKRTGLPLAIREIGSSAGLNLGFDAYRYELGSAKWGEPTSPVMIEAEWQGASPPLDAKLEIASRKGCDLNPLDAGRQADRERMLSYIWPDQTARLARIGAALDMAARSGRAVEKADAAEWVEREFGGAGVKGETRVLMHTIVWQYLPQSVKARIEAAMERAAAGATREVPLAWIGVEADAKDAASASVRLRLWPDGTDEELGRADFHGRWTRWG
ncbi:MAG: DUF2332 family protein [Parvibaculum sp.]|nr:DUF2332 family protein [Parvibaculum sp.]MBO6678579.1 DUF2332 family protein [Parvibaculum sp.]MBO6684088.1 DUF2332 family protein [Parvibaculum sp.]MBO6906297.1 DUF2332 family protein [Parvibaculum sp.]